MPTEFAHLVAERDLLDLEVKDRVRLFAERVAHWLGVRDPSLAVEVPPYRIDLLTEDLLQVTFGVIQSFGGKTEFAFLPVIAPVGLGLSDNLAAIDAFVNTGEMERLVARVLRAVSEDRTAAGVIPFDRAVASRRARPRPR